jgi:hypothetical protein
VNAQPAPPGDAAKRIAGAWRYVGTWVDGQPRNRGANPKGLIYYGPNGEMSVQIGPDHPRPKAGKEPSGDEAKIALDGYIAYFGTYSIDEKAGSVTHHRQSSVQPGDGGDLVRLYEFKDDKLILRPPGVKQEIIWQRIK